MDIFTAVANKCSKGPGSDLAYTTLELYIPHLLNSSDAQGYSSVKGGVTASQLGLSSLTPLSAAGCWDTEFSSITA